jgi:peptidase E
MNKNILLHRRTQDHDARKLGHYDTLQTKKARFIPEAGSHNYQLLFYDQLTGCFFPVGCNIQHIHAFPILRQV